jgi:N4-gp56 family major capsid protein
MTQNIQTYGSPKGRINIIKGEMLAIAEPVEVLAIGCSMKPFPKNRGDNIIYRARIPTGGSAANSNSINRWSVSAAAHLVQEGVTPQAESLTYRDVTVVIQQYACLYSYTDKAADLHEDDIPNDQKMQTAERMPLVREMIRYGVMKASNTVQYAGGTTRATVSSTISYNGLSLMSRTLKANHGKMKTKILAPGPAYDTSAIEASYMVFCHTDCEHDIRRLEDFVPLAKYANRQPINEFEFGSMNNYRFITSPELNSYPDAGATVASTGLYSTTGTNIDVYPIIVCAEDCVNDVALNSNFEVTHIPAKQKTKDDPFGQRGYVGAMFWSAAVVTNPGWIGVLEVGITTLN